MYVRAVLKPTKTIPRVRASLTTKPYPEFNFRHKFSLLVVGPSQSGKTYFVQQILENNRIVYEEQRNIHTGGSELVIGGIAGADSLKSVDGSASAISMAFFEDVGAADHTSGSEVVIGGIAGADSLTSVDGPRSAISMAPFEDVAAADHTSGSELDKLREVSVAEILSVTFDDTAVAIGIRTGEAILWSRALDAKIFLGGDDVSIATAIPGVSCSLSELSSVYLKRL